MSSHKTQQFQLHVWEPEDDFLRSEFNENFSRLDSQIQRIVTGTYTGDGAASRVISLGFRPQAVLLMDQTGMIHNATYTRGGLALDGFDVVYSAGSTVILSVVENGFQVMNQVNNDKISSNKSGLVYHYLALKG